MDMFVDLTKNGSAAAADAGAVNSTPKYRGNYEYDHSRTQICPMCGQSVTRGASFCTHCGANMAADSPKTFNFSGSQPSAYTPQQESTSAKVKGFLSGIVGGFLDMINELNQTIRSRAKNKWVSILLCIFTIFGHKLYEGKIEMAIIYLLTGGLFGIGLVVDVITLLGKPETYYVQ